MPKTKISEYSATAGDNTDIQSIDIAEGCAPSGINDAIRTLMSHLKNFQSGTSADTYNANVAAITTANIVNASVTGPATFAGAVVMSSSLSGTTANITGATTIGGAAVLSSTLAVTGAATFSGATVVSGSFTPTGGSLLKRVRETTTVSATAAANTINYDYITQSVLYYTTNATGNWALNVRGNSGTTLNSLLATGEAATIVFLATQGSTAYYQTTLQVDGSTVSPKWQGGTAPTAGNASSIDSYTVTIIKTADATFTALASQTKFA